MTTEIPEGSYWSRKTTGNWIIGLDPKPVPSRKHDFSWRHVDFDGAPDSGDDRCGTGESEIDCLHQIIELLEST